MRSACAFTTFLAVAMSGCSLVNPPPPLRPPLPANGCQPASVVKHNQAGIGYYKVRQLEAAKGEFLMAEFEGAESADGHCKPGNTPRELGRKTQAPTHLLKA